MDPINFNASIHNLSQMDKHQADAIRTPVALQQLNNTILEKESSKKAETTSEADKNEGKNINPDERKNQSDQHKKKNKKKHHRPSAPNATRGRGGGYFVDVDA